MKHVRKWMRSAILATCNACDGIVGGITADPHPQRRKDYGAILVVGLLVLLLFVAVAVVAVCGLATLAYIAFTTHTLSSCVAAGSMLTAAVVIYAAGRLRRYVYKRFEKGE